MKVFVQLFFFSYLSTKLEIDHDDRNLRATDDENDVDQEEESKQVIELALPDCLHSGNSWCLVKWREISKGEYSSIRKEQRSESIESKKEEIISIAFNA